MPRRKSRKSRRRFSWASLPDEELLKLRLKDLNVRVEGTWLARCLRQLHEELEERGLRVKPHAWISSEWFSTDETPGIAIPFYLAHPRLMRLERKMIIDVEGSTVPECTRILRHEAGHVVQHAYQLQRRRRWQKLFGASSTRYPRYYRPNPASRNYVQHLRLWYAQSHPDEDFAETFAVWLTPRSGWRKRYEGWPALKKLLYVDELMTEIAGQRPKLTRRVKVEPLTKLTQTLEQHYQRKQELYSIGPPTIYDRELTRIFSDDPRHRRSQAASTFLRRNRAKIRAMVSQWTGEYELTLNAVFDDMIARCRELKLRAVGTERQLKMDFTVLLTAKTVHSLYSPSRRQWLAL
ncbi:MAG: putative zinc-binding metallopeptidase [Xanthobacteraceae bacterium]